MKLSTGGYKLLEALEGKKNKLYYCSAGKPTIGIGCVVDPSKYRDVILTDKEVYDLLDAMLKKYEICVNEKVKVPLTQNQYDSLVCFCFNIGVNGFSNSTALRRLNQKDYTGCSEAMSWWKWATHPDGTRHPDLVSRRAQEIELFNSI
jgi:lysozyme